MITNLQQREIFHIAFLRQMAGRLRPNDYAVKGGVNLRLFFGSVRYSEDMDLDVREIEPFKLKDIAMAILASKALHVALRPFGIEKIVPPDTTVAKQTDTTQRFKVHLVTASSEDVFTKIEFSRRNMETPVKTETIDTAVLQFYKMPPLMVSHYPAEAAILQKVRALAGRAATQARDVFDIYMLLPRMKEAGALFKLEKGTLEKAYHNAFELGFAVFRDTVLNYLNEEDRVVYNSKEAWEDIQFKVGQSINEIGVKK